MILINLLPHREAARKRRKDIFNITLGASVLLGGVIAGTVYLWYEAAISRQQSNNQVLSPTAHREAETAKAHRG